MAGGIDWFRWHHGSVNDPKFRTVAKRAGARVGDVIAMWAFVLEHASASATRGNHGNLDFESIDDALGMPEGTAAAIHAAMVAKDLLAEDGSVTAWDRRQPKRERDPAPAGDALPAKTSTERSREHRARKAAAEPAATMQRHATPCNASDGPETPRGEESRKEVSKPSASHPAGGGGLAARFEAFWQAYPRKVGKDAARRAFDKRKPDAALLQRMLAAIQAQRSGEQWQRDGGQFVPHPATWLNQGRWDDEVMPAAAPSLTVPAAETTEQYLARMEAERQASAQRSTPPPADLRERVRRAVA